MGVAVEVLRWLCRWSIVPYGDRNVPSPLPPPPAVTGRTAHPAAARPEGEVELRLRPRLLPLIAVVVVPLGFWVYLAGLAYRTGDLDPRTVPLAAAWLLTTSLAATARITLRGGTLWRRTVGVHRSVSLDDLVLVQVRRAKYFKREGFPFSLVEVRDRDGRAMTWKPFLWADRRKLDRVLATRVEAQQLWIDDRTATWLADATGSDEFARHRHVMSAPLPASPVAVAPPLPTRLSTKQAVVLGLVVVAFVAVTFLSAIAGPRVLSSIRCNAEKHRWTTDADVGGTSIDPAASTESIAEPLASQFGVFELVVGASFVPPDASQSFHDVAQLYVGGQGVAWGGRGMDLNAFVEVDRYESHNAALAYLREWGEWSCERHEFFDVPDVPGAVGVRIADGPRARDHVLFVRGDTVVQVMSVVGQNAGQGQARDLAEYVDQL
jgi:hypothetical protein